MVNFKVLINYVQSEILMITAVKEELEYRKEISDRGYAGKILYRAQRPVGAAEYFSREF